ncbi:MAG: DNA cytosine methyltransferase [Candidatus Cloacimonetes bacterium]|nr:DNA cytosine methyltransferase [Candidatus Cloacimonadota bacterium]
MGRETREGGVRLLTHFSCFSGIGGLDLAAEWAGFQTIGQVEKDDYANKILTKHWPNVPKWRNIEDVTTDAIREAGITQLPTILSGGFPCQPFSCAGQRRGEEDDRYLWPEMLRVVQELRPTWVIGENVTGIISMALDDVCADLECAGYSYRAFVIPAAGVGAPHQRARVFIVAHSNHSSTARQRRDGREVLPLTESEGSNLCGQHVADPSRELLNRSRGARRRGIESTDCGIDVPNPYLLHADSWRYGAGPVCRIGPSPPRLSSCKPTSTDTYSERCKERHSPPCSKEEGFNPWRSDPRGDLWLVEPRVGRVADGVPSRVDRLRCLGNAVVPQQVYPIFRAIAEIECAALRNSEVIMCQPFISNGIG